MGNPVLTPGNNAEWIGARKIAGLDGNGQFRILQIGADGELVGIDYPHYQVHHGNFWGAYKRLEGVANDASVDFLIVTGSGKIPHTTIVVVATANAFLDWYPNPTITNDGTEITPLVMNPATTRTPETKVYFTPTVGAPGTVGPTVVIPGGARQTSVGGAARNGAEIQLAQSKKYLLRVTNKGGAGVIAHIGLQMEWYEEDPAVE